MNENFQKNKSETSGHPRLVVNYILAFLICCLVACGPAHVTIRDHYDFEQIKMMAVLDFSGPEGSYAAEELAKQLIKRGFSVKRNKDMNLDPLTDPAEIQEVGEKYGMDAVIIGTINSSLGYTLKTKMIESTSGDVLWVALVKRSVPPTKRSLRASLKSIAKNIRKQLQKN